MNNYEIQRGKKDGQVVLNSKKIRCQCRSCGAEIDKSERFVAAVRIGQSGHNCRGVKFMILQIWSIVKLTDEEYK